MTQLFDLPQATCQIADSTILWPVRRILCVGRNYAAHAREMGNDPDREPPFFFAKPADAVVRSETEIPFPPNTQDLHYEGELVIAIGTGGSAIAENEALTHVWGYAVGNDLTRRDLQAQAKKMGRPWCLAKGFDRSAVIGAIYRVDAVGHLSRGAIQTRVNGTLKQDADLTEMIWTVPEIISILSHSITLCHGDLIMTGTPAGVGPLLPGDTCSVSIAGLGEITTRLSDPT